jgi:phosphohistidine phosphatase SixA
MRLYFLRHAKTQTFADSGEDFDRSLADKGRGQTEKITQKLGTLGLTQIYCSSAQRTRETLKPFTIAYPNIPVSFCPELYLASLETWKSFLNQHAGDKVLFVGHNEGISEIITHLLEEDVVLKTGTLVALEALVEDPDLLIQGCSVLKEWYRPMF